MTEEKTGTKRINPFLDESIRAIPRLISLLNRNEFFRTKGSFDRNFWHYRAVTGFPSSTFCQGVFPIALLFSKEIFGARTYKNPEILRIAEDALLYWTTLQHDDGSFDEWYPYERSHVATAFTSFAISESLLILRDNLRKEVISKVSDSLFKAGLWLSKNMDDKVLNHTAGAIPALWNINKITPSKLLEEGLKRNLELMNEKSSKEGWFFENGGFDAGYLSLSIDYLWKYYEESNDKEAERLVERGLNFLNYLIHPDGTSGGEYTSRNTRYLMPWGIVATAGRFNVSAEILSRYLKAIEDRNAVTPNTSDDRYMIFFFLPNWMRAAERFEGLPTFVSSSINSLDLIKTFDESGLVVSSRNNSYFVMNFKKAGTGRFFVRKNNNWKLLNIDSGYFVKDSSNKIYTTQALLNEDEVNYISKQRMEISMRLRKVNDSIPLKNYQIFFLIYAYIFGRFTFINSLFEKIVKNIFIRRPDFGELKLVRKINFAEDEIVIEDELSGGTDEYEVAAGSLSTAPHVPTSRYFVSADLEASPYRFKTCLPFKLSWIFNLEEGKIYMKRDGKS